MRALLLVVLLLALPSVARAEHDPVFVSPGVKLGWTFGEGFTYGFEVTFMMPTENPGILFHGPAANLTFGKKSTELRVGYQAISWGVGIEGGPAIVWNQRGTYFGVGITPWIGAFVVPYYTMTFAGAGSRNEAGSYFKLPLCTNCEGGAGGGWGDDGWD